MLHGFLTSGGSAFQDSSWHPSADVYRGSHGWLVKFDLAGVRREDVELTVHGCWLTVSGVRRDLSILEGQQSYSMEISYNRFERSVELPCELEQLRIDTDYRDGMLLVTILAQEEAR